MTAHTCSRLLALALAVFVVHAQDKRITEKDDRFHWKPALEQSAFFLGLQHSFRFATEPDTRADLRGPFPRDYFRTVGNISGWKDGDPAFVNYVGHPVQGSVTNWIVTQNDAARYRKAEFGLSRDYWVSRMRAMAFTSAYSLQFEIGPISEASLGNVQMDVHTGVVDWVVTPGVGTSWMVAEDVLDRYVIRKIEDSTDVRFFRILARGWLNPTRSFSNMLRFRVPWHRDTREGVSTYGRMPAGDD